MKHVQLVNETGQISGIATKLEAHTSPGLWHLAVSVFVTNGSGDWLVQRRALKKYHFAGLWANACCTHPSGSETPRSVAEKRLFEEMGVRASVSHVGRMRYEAIDPVSGLVEREDDHIFTALFGGDPIPNPSEVEEWRWISHEDLVNELRDRSESWVPWVHYAVSKFPSLLEAS